MTRKTGDTLMQNHSIFKRAAQVIFFGIIVFALAVIVSGWLSKENGRKWCSEFANKASLNSALMDKTFKILTSTKDIKKFYTPRTGYIAIDCRDLKEDKVMSALDWKGLFDDVDCFNYALIYHYSPKYEKKVQGETVRLEMIESIYIGDTRMGLRFIPRKTQQGEIDKDDYNLEAECDLRGDRLRRIKLNR